MKALILLLALSGTSAAQNIQLKNGKIVTGKALRRDGDTIIATVEISVAQEGKPAQTGEFGYPLSQITRLDFPEPATLQTAPDLIAQGKGAEALAQLQPYIRYYEGFRDAPGSWWPAVVSLQMQALNGMGRRIEADALADKIISAVKSPDLLGEAQVQLAAGLVSEGREARALEVCEAALKSSRAPGTCALAALTKGRCLLAAKQWEEALLAFLQVPVLYPEIKALLPPAALGAGRAHFEMDDLSAARAAMNDLIAAYPASAEAVQAKNELKKIARREQALAPPK